MGGVRAPSSPFELKPSRHSVDVPPQIIEKTVEKIVACPKQAIDIENLRQEIGILREKLRQEAEKCVLLTQRMAEKPDVPRIVEKLVERQVEIKVPVEVERLVEVHVPLSLWTSPGVKIVAAVSALIGAVVGVML